MNRFFTLLLAASCLTAVGQVTYPYNPDGNADGDIAVGDLQDFLVTYGNPFSPSEIMVGDSSLTYWVEQLSQTVQEQQEIIELLKGGDSRSLEYPDGLSGLVPVQHQFQLEGDYLVPADKNLYLTNYKAGFDQGDLLVDEHLLFPSNDESPRVLASPIILKENSLLSSSGFTGSPQSIIGFLVDKRVEPLVVNIREESFTVPVGKLFVLQNTVVSEVNYSKLYVNSIQVSSGCCTQWSHPDGMVLQAGDVVSPEVFMNESQFNLYGYLVEEDYFDTPLQDPSDEQSDWGCGDPVSYEGHDYQTVKVGGRCWFAETLKYLPSVNNWNDASFDEPRYYVRDYNGNSIDEAYAQSGFDSVGVYYNRAAHLSDICPVGWSVPVVHDWIRLLPVSDGNQNPWPEGGSYLIQPSDWPDPNIEIPPHRYNLWDGFHIQPNGRLFPSSEGYEWDGVGNHFWQNALVNTLIGISFSDLNVDFLINSLGFATTVRCIKDTE